MGLTQSRPLIGCISSSMAALGMLYRHNQQLLSEWVNEVRSWEALGREGGVKGGIWEKHTGASRSSEGLSRGRGWGSGRVSFRALALSHSSPSALCLGCSVTCLDGAPWCSGMRREGSLLTVDEVETTNQSGFWMSHTWALGTNGPVDGGDNLEQSPGCTHHRWELRECPCWRCLRIQHRWCFPRSLSRCSWIPGSPCRVRCYLSCASCSTCSPWFVSAGLESQNRWTGRQKCRWTRGFSAGTQWGWGPWFLWTKRTQVRLFSSLLQPRPESRCQWWARIGLYGAGKSHSQVWGGKEHPRNHLLTMDGTQGQAQTTGPGQEARLSVNTFCQALPTIQGN